MMIQALTSFCRIFHHHDSNLLEKFVNSIPRISNDEDVEFEVHYKP